MNQRSLKSTTACEFNVSSNSSNGVVQVESECPLLLGDQRDHLSVDHNHHYKTPQSSQHHRNQYQSHQISPSSSTLSSSNSSNSSSNSSLSSPPPTQPPLLSANFHHSHQLYSNSHASIHQQSKYRLFSQQPSQTPSHHHKQQQTHLPQQLSQQQGKLNFQRSSFETISESFNRRLICFGYHQQPSPPPQHNHRHKHHFHHHLQHQNHHYLQQQNKAKCDHLHQVKSHGYPNNNTSSFKDDQEIIRSYIQPPPNKTVFNCCDYLNCDSNSGKFS